MTLQSPWALAGLLLAIPLALLHLRRRRPPVRDVPSLLAWRRSPAAVGASSRRLGRPAHPWLLALQLLALALFVLALARPHTDAAAPAPTRAYVVDDSIWMQAREDGHTRLETAQATLRGRLAALPDGERVDVILAGAEPRLLYEGSAGGAVEAVGRVRPTFGPADLAAGLRLAANLPRGDGAVELLRAPEDPAPATLSGSGSLDEEVVGTAIADQGISEPSARCLPGSKRCEIFARVENTGRAAREDRVEVLAAGSPISSQSVRVPAGGSVPVAFKAPPGAHLVLAVDGGDPLPADDRAYIDVAAPTPVRITLIGEKEDAEPLARALLAVPGAEVTVRTPADFRPADARDTDLLVIDGAEPKQPVPAGVPAVLRVDPRRLPGGAVGGALVRSRLSGTDPTAAVLDGVDLGSLTIGRKGGSRIVLPNRLRAAAWSPGGPLLALGTHAGSREAVLAFDPTDSNLPQLASFPRLIENLVAWSQEWVPAAVTARRPFLALRPAGVGPTLIAGANGFTSTSTRTALKLERPGFYALRQRGPWGVRSRPVTANAELVAAPHGAAVSLAAPAAPAGDGTDLAPWLLAAALVVLLVEGALALAVEGPGRAFLVLRGIALALLAGALFQPRIGSEAPPTTVLVQRSAGVDAGGEAVERSWAEAAADCSGRCHVLAFAGAARAAETARPAELEPAATDLEGSVREALAATPAGGRVVLLANGRQTRGDATAATAAARAAGDEVDAVPLPEAGRDAAVTRLQAPEALHAGDPLALQANVRSTVAAPATVSLFEDGAATGSRRVRLAVGDNPYLLSLTAGGPGSHDYRVVVRMAGDETAADDSLTATLRVGRPPHALVVAPARSRLTSMLRGDGMEVTTMTPGQVPTEQAALGDYDLVALDDVAAPELGSDHTAALADAVRTGRTGLLVLGGPHSFSLGAYYSSPLQDALPVSSLKPGNLQRRNLGLEMVLDRSGSMSETVNGVEKFAMVKVAARSATAYVAKHRDQFGAIAFDVAPHEVVPLTHLESPADAAAVNREIDRIRAEGGTDIYKALAAGARAIEASGERNRHIVLLSDGISEKGSYAAIVPRLRAEHITVSTVALGTGADFELLDEIAKATGGHFYAVVDPRELPKIFAKDTKAAARPVRLHGTIGVTPGEDSPIVRDLAGSKLPDLHGNVVTELKPGAGAVLLGQDKDHPPDPTLSQWQYGAGRVVAWTPGLGDEWAAAYARRTQLWADAARWVERGLSPAAPAPRVVPGEEGELEVDEAETAEPATGVGAMEGSIVTPGGRPTALELEPREAWRQTAPLPSPRPGVDAFALRSEGRTSRGLLAVPYSEGLRPQPAEATPLGPLAAATGGRVLADDDTGILSSHRTDLWWWFALVALVCFLADVTVRLLPSRQASGRRPLRPRPGAARDEDRRAEPVGSATSTPA
ncbi:MAG TPA: VWA domain-containing protein [Solirubrobacterales bacterium]|nr:VWA domain-containing protein [Solirubrobacterales bacterium]